MNKLTRLIHIGTVPVGGDSPCSVQSMCSTDTRDVLATIDQINGLADVGCEIVRCAVPDSDAASALAQIKKMSPIPVVADIHFDYRLALQVLDGGIDGLRLNPGNIGEKWKVAEIVASAAERKVPVRIGVNAGSLEKELLRRYGHPSAEAMVESALGHIRILEDLNYQEIKVSLKASDVMNTVAAYRLFSEQSDYPLHIGITEEELVELIIHVGQYAGWPTIGLALRQLHKVVKAGGSRKNSKNTPAQMRKLSKAWER